MAEKQRSRAHFLAGKYQQRIDAGDSGVNDPARCLATEAAAVTEAALALAGCEIDQFTYALTARMARGELTGDQAVEAILTRFMRTSD